MGPVSETKPANKDDSFSPAPCPSAALHPASRDLGLGSGAPAWVNPKEMLARTFFLLCLEILAKLHPELVPGTRRNFDTCIGALTQAEVSHRNIYELRRQLASWIWGRGKTTVEELLPKKTANDTECLRSAISWAESGPHCLSSGCPGTFLTEVLLPQWGFYCFFVVGRKLCGHFKDESRIPLRKRGVVRSQGWGPLGRAGVHWEGGKERTPWCGLSERQEFGRKEQVG